MHSFSTPICLSFSSSLPPPSIVPIMRIHCPNPGCLRNLRSSLTPFKNEAGLSIHLSKSPGCKAYFLKLSATTTTTPHHSSRPVLMSDPTAYVLKKRHLMFNPGCSQLASMDHLENIVSPDYEEAHNDILPLPPNNDDSFVCKKKPYNL